MKLHIGHVYSAHAYDSSGRRVGEDEGYYHFKVLHCKRVYYCGEMTNIFLALKIDVKVSANNEDGSQCFWFDSSGIFEDYYITFELQRRVASKSPRIIKNAK